jgi:hypothetical protein
MTIEAFIGTLLSFHTVLYNWEQSHNISVSKKVATVKIQMLITADYASVDIATGKLNILGAFSRINAKTFPVVHPRMALALKLVADNYNEPTTMRSLEIILSDADGNELMQVSGGVQIPRDERGNRRDANVILELNALEFPHPGIYEFAVYIDAQKIDDTTIELVQLQQ